MSVVDFSFSSGQSLNNALIKIKRGTRAQLNTAKTGSALNVGEPYFITDENRIAIGTAVNNYQDYAKLSEIPSLAGYQPLDADLTAIAALAGTSGLLKKTAADTWALDTDVYVTATEYTWSGKPSAASNSGKYIRITDIGYNGSLWRSNGTVWIPEQEIVLTRAMPTIGRPGTGSFGNNGALTLANALSAIPTESYCYFEANDIATGVPAGLYYTVFSSTTAATVYNNTFNVASDTFTGYPSNPTAFSTTGNGAYSITTTQINITPTITIPANFISNSYTVEASSKWAGANYGSFSTVFYGHSSTTKAQNSTVTYDHGLTKHLQIAFKKGSNISYLSGETSTSGAANASVNLYLALYSANSTYTSFVTDQKIILSRFE